MIMIIKFDPCHLRTPFTPAEFLPLPTPLTDPHPFVAQAKSSPNNLALSLGCMSHEGSRVDCPLAPRPLHHLPGVPAPSSPPTPRISEESSATARSAPSLSPPPPLEVRYCGLGGTKHCVERAVDADRQSKGDSVTTMSVLRPGPS